eukprot:852258-Pyramimonas_sp.AAC.1
MTNAQRGLQAWATKMWAPTPGVLHRCARGTIDKLDEILTNTELLFTPQRSHGPQGRPRAGYLGEPQLH